MRNGRISCSLTRTPRRAICQGASHTAKPPPMIWIGCMTAVVVNNSQDVNGRAGDARAAGMCEGLICLLTAGFLAQAAPLDRAAAGHEIAAQFQELSLPVPTVRRVIVCHGFACKYRTLIHFGAGDTTPP